MSAEWVIIGDQAWLPDEWEREMRRREAERRKHPPKPRLLLSPEERLRRRREYQRQYRLRPEIRERRRVYLRDWNSRNREKVRVYKREWMRTYRARKAE